MTHKNHNNMKSFKTQAAQLLKQQNVPQAGKQQDSKHIS